MENLKDLEKKISTYKQALDDVTKELTKKRSELGALAHQTVENFENSIPALKKTVEDLETQVANLNITILQKNKDVSQERDNHKSHYEKLEQSLREVYEKRKEELDAVEENQRSRNEHYSKVLADLELREIQLKNGNATLEALRQTFNQQVKSFDEHQKVELENIRLLSEDASKIKQIAQSEENIWKFKNKDLANRFEELESKIQDANATVAKMAEANQILEAAKAKEKSNQEREEKINQMNIKALADKGRNNIRTDELDKKERDLKQREENLKLAEASIKV